MIVTAPAGLRRALVRAAFTDYRPQPSVVYRHACAWSQTPPVIWTGADGAERLMVVIPTVSRATDRELSHLGEAVATLRREWARLECAVVVALHDAAGAAHAAAIVEQLEHRWADDAIPWIGLTLTDPSKVLALNCTVPLLDANAATAIAWFDDDVKLEPGCLAALWREFDPAPICVYGARAVLTPSRRESPNPYPYGCAMLMSRATFGDGIPLVYMSDDHYFTLSLLDPGAPDPLHRLRVVPDAIVRVPPPRSATLAVRRVVRNYRNVQRVIVDVDEETTRWFRRRLHFSSLRPPKRAREALSVRYWAALAFDSVRAVLWQALVVELLLRGLLQRPRPGLWSSDRRR